MPMVMSVFVIGRRELALSCKRMEALARCVALLTEPPCACAYDRRECPAQCRRAFFV